LSSSVISYRSIRKAQLFSGNEIPCQRPSDYTSICAARLFK
jgi:hypothetical protein